MEEVLSLRQMARRLNVTVKWLRAEADAGRVPCLPAGKNRYLFNPDAVEKALAERAQGHQEESDTQPPA